MPECFKTIFPIEFNEPFCQVKMIDCIMTSGFSIPREVGCRILRLNNIM